MPSASKAHKDATTRCSACAESDYVNDERLTSDTEAKGAKYDLYRLNWNVARAKKVPSEAQVGKMYTLMEDARKKWELSLSYQENIS